MREGRKGGCVPWKERCPVYKSRNEIERRKRERRRGHGTPEAESTTAVDMLCCHCAVPAPTVAAPRRWDVAVARIVILYCTVCCPGVFHRPSARSTGCPNSRHWLRRNAGRTADRRDGLLALPRYAIRPSSTFTGVTPAAGDRSPLTCCICYVSAERSDATCSLTMFSCCGDETLSLSLSLAGTLEKLLAIRI